MAINGASTLRMSGMNSGLDTEAIVEAMTASTKLRITTEKRKILKLEAQQDAYREITAAVTEFKDKYFDILKRDSCLRSGSFFNQYKATTSKADGTEGAPAGISVTTSEYAVPANYQVTVQNAATQTKVTSNSLDQTGNFDASLYSDSSKTYAMEVTVGSKSQVISFKGGTEDEVRDSLNASLKDAFGTTNSGDGRVSIDENFKISSSDKSTITKTSAIELTDKVNLTTDFETGANSITIIAGGETRTFSFNTLEDGYFDDIFARDANGDLEYDADGKVKYKEIVMNGTDAEAAAKYIEDVKTRSEKVALYESVISKDMYIRKYTTEYDTWAENNDTTDAWGDFEKLTDDQKNLVISYAERTNEKNAEKLFDTAANKLYGKEYIEYYKGFDKAEDAKDFHTWLSDEKGVTLEQFKDGQLAATDGFDEAYSDYQKRYNITDPNVTGEQYDQFLSDMKGLMTLNKQKDMFVTLYTEGGDLSGLSGVHQIDETDFMNNQAQNPNAVVDAYNKNSFMLIEKLGFLEEENKDLSISYEWTERNGSTPPQLIVSAYRTDKDGNKVAEDLGIMSNSGSKMGLEETNTTASTVAKSTKLSELGSDLDEFKFSINGVDFEFSGDKTIAEVINAVNSSSAGVNMSLSTLTNSFVITSNTYGTDGKIEFSDNLSDEDIAAGKKGLLSTFGFTGDASQTETGKNMTLEINGSTVETSSNSYTIDGTTFTVASNVKAGTEISTVVEKDNTKAIETIKSFVEDYNKLIEKVYGYVDEKPNKDYHFLTDDDKTDMDLSEKQEEMWDKVAKQGILYNDSTLTGMMSKFRTALFGSTTLGDGSKFGLYNMGITTSGDYTSHGKLVLDEAKLAKAFETNGNDIMKLFTDSENGIMTEFNKITESYVKTTGKRGEKGLLVDKAGVANKTSATDNSIYDKIKSSNKLISSLESRLKQQEDRYWSIFSSLESQMGDLNGQTSYITQMMGM